MPTSTPAFTTPHIVLTVQLSAPDMNVLLDLIEQVSATVDDPDRIAPVRVDEDACCAEMDFAARPVDPRRLH